MKVSIGTVTATREHKWWRSQPSPAPPPQRDAGEKTQFTIIHPCTRIGDVLTTIRRAIAIHPSNFINICTKREFLIRRRSPCPQQP